jgi:molecular chaperone DnaJ
VAVQTEWLEKDYYEVLGVPATASEKDIQRAYRRLARQLHPDANPDNPSAEERFKAVSAAYDVVGDPGKRKEYDEVRRLGPMAGGFAPGGGGGGGGGFSFRADDLGDLGGLFGNLFGRGAGQGGARPAAARGRDLEAEVRLRFEDAVLGTTTTLHIEAEVACETCGGSGARPGTAPTTCPRCGGVGTVSESQGFFALSQPCPECSGRGTVVSDPCGDCQGRGTRHRPRQVKVRIPAGVEDGQLIRLTGRGDAGRNGGPPGDLFVAVRVERHRLFGRAGRNLTLTVPISYPEAVLGADIKVPTLDGPAVTVRIPPGTPSGRTLRVRGHGVADQAGGRGDLLVTVEVAVPTRLTEPEREAVEALARTGGTDLRAHLGV